MFDPAHRRRTITFFSTAVLLIIAAQLVGYVEKLEALTMVGRIILNIVNFRFVVFTSPGGPDGYGLIYLRSTYI